MNYTTADHFASVVGLISTITSLLGALLAISLLIFYFIRKFYQRAAGKDDMKSSADSPDLEIATEIVKGIRKK